MVETNRVLTAVACVFLAGFQTAPCAEQFGQLNATSNVHMQEWNAYYHPASDERNFSDAKSKYLLKLSPGGRIFFLTNRKDFAEALSELKRFDRQNTGSALYVKALCLDGLKKHAEAVQCFAAAQSKIDLVFHPGAKFYLQYATALMHAGDFSAALHNLDIVDQMCKSGAEKGTKNQYENSGSVRKRKAAIYEMQGRYKEALTEYVLLCGNNASHFKLDSAMKTAPLLQEDVTKWLQENRTVPSESAFQQSEYLMMKGKAYVLLGQADEAKLWLAKALSIFEDEKIIKTLKPKLQERVSQYEYQTKCMLVRVDYELGNFKECCKTMRTIAGKGLTNEFDNYFTTMSMADVPQLVKQKDVVLHSINLEQELDFVDYLHNPVAADKKNKDTANKVPAIDETLLIQARKEIGWNAYEDCYETLQKFIDANVVEGSAPAQMYLRGFKFAELYLHKVRMLRLGVGFARAYPQPQQALSLRGDINPVQSEFWSCVEDRMLGRKQLFSAKDSSRVKNNPAFVPWCHYAIGLRALSKKNYKAAAAEFGAVKLSERIDKDLPIYSKVLKTFCERKR